ncbi:MAG: PIN domain-containing protein [Holosporales bacterium]|jgi:tRNA(fMet)-specific endonuclease VapC
MTPLSRPVYLLDTATVVDFLRGEKGTLIAMRATSAAHIALSVLSDMEIEYGFARVGSRLQDGRTMYQAWRRQVQLLPVTVDIANAAGLLRGYLNDHGHCLSVLDIITGATALHHDLTLVTANPEGFFGHFPDLEILCWRDEKLLS